MTTITIPYMPELARELAPHVGIRIADKCAIFLQQVAYWQARTSRHKPSEKGWVWKTITDWAGELFWSIPTVRRIAAALTELGVIEREKKRAATEWDQTYFYRLVPERLKALISCSRSLLHDRSDQTSNLEVIKSEPSSNDPKITVKEHSHAAAPERSFDNHQQPNSQQPVEKDFLDWVIKNKISRLPAAPVFPALAARAAISRDPGLRAEYESIHHSLREREEQLAARRRQREELAF